MNDYMQNKIMQAKIKKGACAKSWHYFTSGGKIFFREMELFHIVSRSRPRDLCM